MSYLEVHIGLVSNPKTQGIFWVAVAVAVAVPDYASNYLGTTLRISSIQLSAISSHGVEISVTKTKKNSYTLVCQCQPAAARFRISYKAISPQRDLLPGMSPYAHHAHYPAQISTFSYALVLK